MRIKITIMMLLRFFAIIVCWFLAAQAFALTQNGAVPQRPCVAPEIAASLLTKAGEPGYPQSAIDDHVAGDVLLRIIIDQQGSVIEATPISRDEWPPNPALTEDPRLRESAMAAVKHWKYLPYLLNGQPVEVETQVVVKFSLVAHPVLGGVIDGRLFGENGPHPKVAAPKYPRVSQSVMEGNLLKHVDPVYPAIARMQHIRGEVLLSILVDKEGTVISVRAVSGHPLLLPFAIDAVYQWKYKPYILNGEPVQVEGNVLVTFKM